MQLAVKIMTKKVKVIGCGLAGAEASYQLAKRGFLVKIYIAKYSKRRKRRQNNLLFWHCRAVFYAL